MTTQEQEQPAAGAEPEASRKPRGVARKPPAATTRAKSVRKHSPGKKAAKSRPNSKATKAGQGTKTADVLSLLQKSKGATLVELMKATGWQAHSVRGFLSGTLRKKMGLKLQSAKRGDGERVYSIPR
jgi:hypothetical protein